MVVKIQTFANFTNKKLNYFRNIPPTDQGTPDSEGTTSVLDPVTTAIQNMAERVSYGHLQTTPNVYHKMSLHPNVNKQDFLTL